MRVVVLVLAVGGSLVVGIVATSRSTQVTLPAPPARQAGQSEDQFIAATSLSEIPDRRVTPVAAVDARGVPLPNSKAIVAALRARDGKTVTFATPTVVDFGHVVAGEYTRPGATADPVSDYPGFFRSVDPGLPGRLTLADGDWYAARYVRLPARVPIDVVGFRFVSDPARAPATLAATGGAMQGSFLASDPTLTRVWYAAASTMQLSMMTATPGEGFQFLDSPERDRTEWLWYDASADDTAFYTFGARALAVAKRSYEASAVAPGKFVVSPADGIPDQNGFTERDLAQLFRFYGDRSILNRFYADLVRHETTVVDRRERGDGLYATGILPVPPSPVNPAVRTDASLETQMWVYAGFLGLAQLARAQHDGGTIDLAERRAHALRDAVNRLLWDDGRGAYVDYVGSSHVDEAGNAMAVTYQLATPSQARRILAYLHAHNDRVYDWAGSKTWGTANPAGSTDFDRPFLPGDSDLNVADWSAPYTRWGWSWGMGANPDDFSPQYNYNSGLVPWAEAFEAQADFTVGDDAAGIDLIDRAWGTMLRQGPSTLYELSRSDGTPAYELGSQHDTVMHRWASGVGALLQQDVLGVTPLSPGFTSWGIEPHGGSLSWAQGRVPTPEGALSVWWRRSGPTSAPRAYVMGITAPSGTTGRTLLPVPDSGVVMLDGHVAWERGIASSSARFDPSTGRVEVAGLGPGNHLIRWTPR